MCRMDHCPYNDGTHQRRRETDRDPQRLKWKPQLNSEDKPYHLMKNTYVRDQKGEIEKTRKIHHGEEHANQEEDPL